jgi:hypothetical protein
MLTAGFSLPVVADNASVSGVNFQSQALAGAQCPQPWWGDPAFCGESGSFISAIVGQPVTVSFVLNGISGCGTWKAEVRADIVLWPDYTAQTLTGSACSNGKVIAGSFTPTRPTVGLGGVWPFDIGAVHEYFLKVSWNGNVIYDPTNTLTVWSIPFLGIPIYASQGRPYILAECPGGSTPAINIGC